MKKKKQERQISEDSKEELGITEVVRKPKRREEARLAFVP